MDNNAENKINSARDGVTQIGKDLRTDAHTAIDKVADQVPPATDRLATSAHNGVDQVADSVESASSRLAASSKQMAATYKKLAESGRTHVRSSPAISVLLAAAAGYGLSKLIGSRKD